jgi:hypothetical protein
VARLNLIDEKGGKVLINNKETEKGDPYPGNKYGDDSYRNGNIGNDIHSDSCINKRKCN